MKKIFSFLVLVVFTCSLTYAGGGGSWVLGVNQVKGLLDRVEQGTGEEPPFFPDGTDLGNWENLDWLTLNEEDLYPEYLNAEVGGDSKWRGIASINFSARGYKQLEGTLISIAQPSLNEYDYTEVPVIEGEFNDPNIGETGKSLGDYFDRYDLSWLEELDFSGNDFSSVVISGGPYQVMPLRILNFSDNPNLTDLSVNNLQYLELVDVRGTGLSEQQIQWLIADVQEFSPAAEILTGPTSIKSIEASPAAYFQGNMINIKNKPAGTKASVYDIYGRLLLESYENTFSVDSFAKGVYLIKIDNQVSKILKK